MPNMKPVIMWKRVSFTIGFIVVIYALGKTAQAEDLFTLKADTRIFKVYESGPPNKPNGNPSTHKLDKIDYSMKYTIRPNGALEIDGKCVSSVPHLPKPPFRYKRENTTYAQLLGRLGLRLDHPDDDPSLAISQVAQTLRTANIAYTLQHDLGVGVQNQIFIGNGKAVCVAFHGDSSFSTMSIAPIEGFFGGLLCVGKPYPEDSPYATLCNDDEEQKSTTDSSTNSSGGNGGGNTSSNNGDQIAALLSGGLSRSALIELHICAAERLECRLDVKPENVRRSLNIATREEAEQQLLEKLKA